VWISLTNFTAQIISDILRDDGAGTAREFEVKADLQGRSSRFLVPARQFDGLSWVTEHLEAHAICSPGQLMNVFR
jgi:hypothetical protein